MRFIKLHQDGKELLVNMSNVSDVHEADDSNKSWLYFNCAVDNEQVRFMVDESIDEILELIKWVLYES